MTYQWLNNLRGISFFEQIYLIAIIRMVACKWNSNIVWKKTENNKTNSKVRNLWRDSFIPFIRRRKKKNGHARKWERVCVCLMVNNAFIEVYWDGICCDGMLMLCIIWIFIFHTWKFLLTKRAGIFFCDCSKKKCLHKQQAAKTEIRKKWTAHSQRMNGQGRKKTKIARQNKKQCEPLFYISLKAFGL